MDASSILEPWVGWPLRVVSYPAPDMRGVWIAHPLDLDSIAHGESPEDVGKLLSEAVWELIAFRLSRGLSPLELSPVPAEVWQLAEDAVGGKLERSCPFVPVDVIRIAPTNPQMHTQLIVSARAPVPPPPHGR
jgi:hypothetical protein